MQWEKDIQLILPYCDVVRILEALDSVKPMQVYEYRINSGYAYFYCPSCYATVEVEYQRYCGSCGQHLRWCGYVTHAERIDYQEAMVRWERHKTVRRLVMRGKVSLLREFAHIPEYVERENKENEYIDGNKAD